MKAKTLCPLIVLTLLVTLISCGDDDILKQQQQNNLNPVMTTPSAILPEAPGLVGTFSGNVRNIENTKNGTLTISITSYDRNTGLLRGSLLLAGFSDCYTFGVFPRPEHLNDYDNHYIPERGFGSIIAGANHSNSYSFLYFMASNDFTKGLELNGITEELGFFDGHQWCLEIAPVVLKRHPDR